MKGSIINRPKGSNRWSIILEVQDEATGKRKRRWHAFTGTKSAARVECARLITELKSGNALEPNKATVALFLARWLAHIKTQVSPKTHERYSGIINQNVVPALGAVRLNKLKPVQISEAYSAALDAGRLMQGRIIATHRWTYAPRFKASSQPGSEVERAEPQSRRFRGSSQSRLEADADLRLPANRGTGRDRPRNVPEYPHRARRHVRPAPWCGATSI